MTDVLSMYTIYEHPLDHPKHFVVRRWTIRPGAAVPTDDIELASTLEAARRFVPPGLVMMTREPEDDPKIVETWV